MLSRRCISINSSCSRELHDFRHGDSALLLLRNLGLSSRSTGGISLFLRVSLAAFGHSQLGHDSQLALPTLAGESLD